MLSVQNLSKSYGVGSEAVPVFSDLSFEVPPASSIALMGESGAGKTTLLHVLAGLEPADGGLATLDGTALIGLSDAERAAIRRTKLGLIFQQYNLIASLSVRDNLAFQARLAGVYDRDWTAYLAARLGLEGLEARWPEKLSGGQQQRVAIGRTLAARPRLVMADEPTGNLDEATSDKVLKLCLELVAESGSSLLMVTHSEHLAATLGAQWRLAGGVLHQGT